jgi:Zn-dependent peptidase ImmA (M78 family)/DNA-binding transcriptional regulator YiaG
MTSPEFPVTAEVLRWARETAGFSPEDVATRLGAVSKKITAETLLDWEEGGAFPRLTALRRLAKLYKRPMSVFFLEQPPAEPAPPRNFRLLPSGEPRPLSPETLLAVRTARTLYRLAKDVSQSLGYETAVSLPTASLTDDPERLAARERKRLGASLATQLSFRDGGKALWYWRDLLESQGCFVFQLSFPAEDVRAFSELIDEGPVIVLSSKEELEVARIFSLFHEYAHLLVRLGGICPEFTLSYTSSYEGRVEQFCNAFAAHFLVPTADFQAEASSMEDALTDEGVRHLSYKFSVSKHVILRRFSELRWITTEEYKSRAAAQRKRQRKHTHGGPPPDIKSVSQRGRRLVGLVLEASDRGFLTPPEVVEGLGVRSPFFADVRQRLAGEARSG